MSQGNPLNNLANAGYEQSGPINPEQEAMANSHVLSMMPTGGYSTATSAAPNLSGFQGTQGQLGGTEQQQQQLASQLQAGAAGMGPNAGQAQLQAATGQNIKQAAALSAAAAASGAGGAGAARYNAANAAGEANQAAGNQAAQMGAQSQQAAMQGLAGVQGQMAGEQLGAGEQQLNAQQLEAQNQQFNAGAQNTESQFGAQEQAGQAQLANEMNQGQFAQQYGLEQSQNAAVAGLEGQQEQNQSNMTNNAIGGIAGAGAAGLALLAKGGVIRGPHEIVAGEKGREAEVPVPPQAMPRAVRPVVGMPRLAGGGMVGIGGITPDAATQDYAPHIASLQQMTQDTIAKIHGVQPQQAQSGPAQSFSPVPTKLKTGPLIRKPQQPAAGAPVAGASPASNWSSPVTEDPIMGGGGEQMAGPDAPAMGAPAAHGRLLTKPTILEAGENGPEAFIPVKKDGEADMARAKDPGVRQLIADHPEYRHPLSADSGGDVGDQIAALKAEVLKLEKLHKSTRKRAA